MGKMKHLMELTLKKGRGHHHFGHARVVVGDFMGI
jgi:hypothetical protein